MTELSEIRNQQAFCECGEPAVRWGMCAETWEVLPLALIMLIALFSVAGLLLWLGQHVSLSWH
jgi:hypothetical protein